MHIKTNFSFASCTCIEMNFLALICAGFVGSEHGYLACDGSNDQASSHGVSPDYAAMSSNEGSPHSPASPHTGSGLDSDYALHSPGQHEQELHSPADSMCSGVDDMSLQPPLSASPLDPDDHSVDHGNNDLDDGESGSPSDKFYCICRQAADNVDDRFMMYVSVQWNNKTFRHCSPCLHE